jgi:Uma2 family endonuclease
MSTPIRDAASLLALQSPRRLRVEEYHRMIEAGIFDEDEHVELLEGLLVAMTPQREDHGRVIQILTEALIRALPSGEYAVRPQLPLTLGADSEPEPDVAVVRAADARSREEHPRRAVLVVEVSGDSLRKDREVKGALYARTAIPEYWIVNLADRCVEVYRDPDAGAGRHWTLTTAASGSDVASPALPGFSIPVASLLD